MKNAMDRWIDRWIDRSMDLSISIDRSIDRCSLYVLVICAFIDNIAYGLDGFYSSTATLLPKISFWNLITHRFYFVEYHDTSVGIFVLMSRLHHRLNKTASSEVSGIFCKLPTLVYLTKILWKYWEFKKILSKILGLIERSFQ